MPKSRKAVKAFNDYRERKNENVPERNVAEAYYFTAKEPDNFESCDKAKRFIEKKGWSKGSMQCDAPIAIATRPEVYISKWRNLGRDVSKIDGVLIPDNDFRNSNCALIIFEDRV